MSNQIQVRAATPEDTEGLLRLWIGLVDYHKRLETVRPVRWSGPVEETLRSLIAQTWTAADRCVMVVAEGAGVIVGFVRVSLAEDGPCLGRIDTLFVADAFRGQHVGARLLGSAYAWCRERGAREVCVAFIAPNKAAREFYEHSGFQPLLSTYMRRL